MSSRFIRVIAAALMLMLGNTATAEPVVRVGVLKFGTVNWELDVIHEHGLDVANGIRLEIVPLASKSATNVAIQGGAVDVIVSDWIWVSRQRAEGRDYTLAPYSMTVGGLVVHPDAKISTLSDLRGRRLGVAGGPVDKSWLFLRAYAKRRYGMDLQAELEPNFAAPPLLNQLLLRGEIPAVLNFWHYLARLKAVGMKELLSISDILTELGIEKPLPLLGWVFSESWGTSHRDAIDGFLRASYAAKKLLGESDPEWERIQPLTKAKDPKMLMALRDAYRLGIPRGFGDDELHAAKQAFAVLAEEGGTELVGTSTRLQPGTFWVDTPIGQ